MDVDVSTQPGSLKSYLKSKYGVNTQQSMNDISKTFIVKAGVVIVMAVKHSLTISPLISSKDYMGNFCYR